MEPIHLLNFSFTSSDIRELGKALNKCREQFPKTGKSGEIKGRSKYATSVEIYEAALPILNANNICMFQNLIRQEITEFLVTTLLHLPSGQWIKDERILESESNNQQSKGAAQSYQRKYALLLLSGIVPDDDDLDAESTNVEPITQAQHKEIVDTLRPFTNREELHKKLLFFNKIKDLNDLGQDKFNMAMGYIRKNGTRE